MSSKLCSICGENKPLTEYHKRPGSKDGLRADCKACCLARGQKYRKDNPEKAHAYRIGYYADNAELAKQQARDWAADNPERAKQIKDDWAKNNPDKIKEAQRKHRNLHPESVKATQKDWENRNPDKLRAKDRRYRDRHPEKHTIKESRRRVRKRGLPDNFTPNDLTIAMTYFDNRCAVCGRPRGLFHTIALDHWIPVASANCPGTVPENIIPLCHGIDGCNNSKNDKPAGEWLISRYGKRKAAKVLERIESYINYRQKSVSE